MAAIAAGSQDGPNGRSEKRGIRRFRGHFFSAADVSGGCRQGLSRLQSVNPGPNSFTSATDSGLVPIGMRGAPFIPSMRCIRILSLLLPSTMAGPDVPPCMITASESSWSFPIALSPKWQVAHERWKIGNTSLLKLGGAGPAARRALAGVEPEKSAADSKQDHPVRWIVLLNEDMALLVRVYRK